jgi:hypothetical protein
MAVFRLAWKNGKPTEYIQGDDIGTAFKSKGYGKAEFAHLSDVSQVNMTPAKALEMVTCINHGDGTVSDVDDRGIAKPDTRRPAPF